MKLKLFFSAIIIFFIFSGFNNTLAIYDPLSTPNNKIGVHILFPSELQKARELVNSSGGDWGYVTIPIQTGDKDLEKWQHFMDEAGKLHLIPLVRLATEGDYFNKESWSKPEDSDIVDFANFLNSLSWPVKNKYIIVYNEVNRADEWEGEANPKEYAEILSFAVDAFKAKDQDFFIISSGMDNAAATNKGTYSQYDFFEEMNSSDPGVFSKIDGIASHSYPNPAFSQPPTTKTRQSITSFLYEKEMIDKFAGRKLPVFVTETGWDQGVVSQKKTGEYFKHAFENVWNDEDIVAITPFLLNAGMGPFEKFSLLNKEGHKNEVFQAIESYSKISGKPIINAGIIEKKQIAMSNKNLPVKNFSNKDEDKSGKELKYFVKWLLVPL